MLRPYQFSHAAPLPISVMLRDPYTLLHDCVLGFTNHGT